MRNKIQKKAFTLLEILIVVAILGIMMAGAIITFNKWFVKSRDAVRKADINAISNAIETYKLEYNRYPAPDSYLQVTDWSGNNLWQQWEFWTGVYSLVPSLTKLPRDIVTNEFYGYSVTNDGRFFQLLAWMEGEVDTGNVAYLFSNGYAYDKGIPYIQWNFLWYLMYQDGYNRYWIIEAPSLFLYTGNIVQTWSLFIESGLEDPVPLTEIKRVDITLLVKLGGEFFRFEDVVSAVTDVGHKLWFEITGPWAWTLSWEVDYRQTLEILTNIGLNIPWTERLIIAWEAGYLTDEQILNTYDNIKWILNECDVACADIDGCVCADWCSDSYADLWQTCNGFATPACSFAVFDQVLGLFTGVVWVGNPVSLIFNNPVWVGFTGVVDLWDGTIVTPSDPIEHTYNSAWTKEVKWALVNEHDPNPITKQCTGYVNVKELLLTWIEEVSLDLVACKLYLASPSATSGRFVNVPIPVGKDEVFWVSGLKASWRSWSGLDMGDGTVFSPWTWFTEYTYSGISSYVLEATVYKGTPGSWDYKEEQCYNVVLAKDYCGNWVVEDWEECDPAVNPWCTEYCFWRWWWEGIGSWDVCAQINLDFTPVDRSAPNDVTFDARDMLQINSWIAFTGLDYGDWIFNPDYTWYSIHTYYTGLKSYLATFYMYNKWAALSGDIVTGSCQKLVPLYGISDFRHLETCEIGQWGSWYIVPAMDTTGVNLGECVPQDWFIPIDSSYCGKTLPWGIDGVFKYYILSWVIDCGEDFIGLEGYTYFIGKDWATIKSSNNTRVLKVSGPRNLVYNMNLQQYDSYAGGTWYDKAVLDIDNAYDGKFYTIRSKGLGTTDTTTNLNYFRTHYWIILRNLSHDNIFFNNFVSSTDMDDIAWWVMVKDASHHNKFVQLQVNGARRGLELQKWADYNIFEDFYFDNVGYQGEYAIKIDRAAFNQFLNGRINGKGISAKGVYIYNWDPYGWAWDLYGRRRVGYNIFVKNNFYNVNPAVSLVASIGNKFVGNIFEDWEIRYDRYWSRRLRDDDSLNGLDKNIFESNILASVAGTWRDGRTSDTTPSDTYRVAFVKNNKYIFTWIDCTTTAVYETDLWVYATKFSWEIVTGISSTIEDFSYEDWWFLDSDPACDLSNNGYVGWKYVNFTGEVVYNTDRQNISTCSGGYLIPNMNVGAIWEAVQGSCISSGLFEPLTASQCGTIINDWYEWKYYFVDGTVDCASSYLYTKWKTVLIWQWGDDDVLIISWVYGQPGFYARGSDNLIYAIRIEDHSKNDVNYNREVRWLHLEGHNQKIISSQLYGINMGRFNQIFGEGYYNRVVNLFLGNTYQWVVYNNEFVNSGNNLDFALEIDSTDKKTKVAFNTFKVGSFALIDKWQQWEVFGNDFVAWESKFYRSDIRVNYNRFNSLITRKLFGLSGNDYRFAGNLGSLDNQQSVSLWWRTITFRPYQISWYNISRGLYAHDDTSPISISDGVWTNITKYTQRSVIDINGATFSANLTWGLQECNWWNWWLVPDPVSDIPTQWRCIDKNLFTPLSTGDCGSIIGNWVDWTYKYVNWTLDCGTSSLILWGRVVLVGLNNASIISDNRDIVLGVRWHENVVYDLAFSSEANYARDCSWRYCKYSPGINSLLEWNTAIRSKFYNLSFKGKGWESRDYDGSSPSDPHEFWRTNTYTSLALVNQSDNNIVRHIRVSSADSKDTGIWIRLQDAQKNDLKNIMINSVILGAYLGKGANYNNLSHIYADWGERKYALYLENASFNKFYNTRFNSEGYWSNGVMINNESQYKGSDVISKDFGSPIDEYYNKYRVGWNSFYHNSFYSRDKWIYFYASRANVVIGNRIRGWLDHSQWGYSWWARPPINGVPENLVLANEIKWSVEWGWMEISYSYPNVKFDQVGNYYLDTPANCTSPVDVTLNVWDYISWYDDIISVRVASGESVIYDTNWVSDNFPLCDNPNIRYQDILPIAGNIVTWVNFSNILQECDWWNWWLVPDPDDNWIMQETQWRCIDKALFENFSSSNCGELSDGFEWKYYLVTGRVDCLDPIYSRGRLIFVGQGWGVINWPTNGYVAFFKWWDEAVLWVSFSGNDVNSWALEVGGINNKFIGNDVVGKGTSMLVTDSISYSIIKDIVVDSSSFDVGLDIYNAFKNLYKNIRILGHSLVGTKGVRLIWAAENILRNLEVVMQWENTDGIYMYYTQSVTEYRWENTYNTLDTISTLANPRDNEIYNTDVFASNFAYWSNALKNILKGNRFYEGDMYHYYSLAGNEDTIAFNLFWGIFPGWMDFAPESIGNFYRNYAVNCSASSSVSTATISPSYGDPINVEYTSSPYSRYIYWNDKLKLAAVSLSQVSYSYDAPDSYKFIEVNPLCYLSGAGFKDFWRGQYEYNMLTGVELTQSLKNAPIECSTWGVNGYVVPLFTEANLDSSYCVPQSLFKELTGAACGKSLWNWINWSYYKISSAINCGSQWIDLNWNVVLIGASPLATLEWDGAYLLRLRGHSNILYNFTLKWSNIWNLIDVDNSNSNRIIRLRFLGGGENAIYLNSSHANSIYYNSYENPSSYSTFFHLVDSTHNILAWNIIGGISWMRGIWLERNSQYNKILYNWAELANWWEALYIVGNSTVHPSYNSIYNNFFKWDVGIRNNEDNRFLANDISGDYLGVNSAAKAVLNNFYKNVEANAFKVVEDPVYEYGNYYSGYNVDCSSNVGNAIQRVEDIFASDLVDISVQFTNNSITSPVDDIRPLCIPSYRSCSVTDVPNAATVDGTKTPSEYIRDCVATSCVDGYGLWNGECVQLVINSGQSIKMSVAYVFTPEREADTTISLYNPTNVTKDLPPIDDSLFLEPTNFHIASTTCGNTLAAGASCDITIQRRVLATWGASTTITILDASERVYYPLKFYSYNRWTWSYTQIQYKYPLGSVSTLLGNSFYAIANNAYKPICYQQSNWECEAFYSASSPYWWVKDDFGAQEIKEMELVPDTPLYFYNGADIFPFYENFRWGDIDTTKWSIIRSSTDYYLAGGLFVYKNGGRFPRTTFRTLQDFSNYDNLTFETRINRYRYYDRWFGGWWEWLGGFRGDDNSRSALNGKLSLGAFSTKGIMPDTTKWYTIQFSKKDWQTSLVLDGKTIFNNGNLTGTTFYLWNLSTSSYGRRWWGLNIDYVLARSTDDNVFWCGFGKYPYGKGCYGVLINSGNDLQMSPILSTWDTNWWWTVTIILYNPHPIATQYLGNIDSSYLSNQTNFRVTSTNCGTTLAPGDSCEVTFERRLDTVDFKVTSEFKVGTDSIKLWFIAPVYAVFEGAGTETDPWRIIGWNTGLDYVDATSCEWYKIMAYETPWGETNIIDQPWSSAYNWWYIIDVDGEDSLYSPEVRYCDFGTDWWVWTRIEASFNSGSPSEVVKDSVVAAMKAKQVRFENPTYGEWICDFIWTWETLKYQFDNQIWKKTSLSPKTNLYELKDPYRRSRWSCRWKINDYGDVADYDCRGPDSCMLLSADRYSSDWEADYYYGLGPIESPPSFWNNWSFGRVRLITNYADIVTISNRVNELPAPGSFDYGRWWDTSIIFTNKSPYMVFLGDIQNSLTNTSNFRIADTNCIWVLSPYQSCSIIVQRRRTTSQPDTLVTGMLDLRIAPVYVYFKWDNWVDYHIISVVNPLWTGMKWATPEVDISAFVADVSTRPQFRLINTNGDEVVYCFNQANEECSTTPSDKIVLGIGEMSPYEIKLMAMMPSSRSSKDVVIYNPNSEDAQGIQVRLDVYPLSGSITTWPNFNLVDNVGNTYPYCVEQWNGECSTNNVLDGHGISGYALMVRYFGVAWHPSDHAGLLADYQADIKAPLWMGLSPEIQTIGGYGDYYNILYTTWLYVQEPGTWWFAIDWDDAVEVEIDGNVVAGYYGGHGFCNCYDYSSSVSLGTGRHKIIVRHEDDSGWDGVRLSFKSPIDTDWLVFNAENLSGKGVMYAYMPDIQDVSSQDFVINGLPLAKHFRIRTKINISGFDYRLLHIEDSNTNIAVDGNSIFELYDDFNAATLDTNKWTAGSTYYSLENGFLKTWNNWWNAMIASIDKFDLPLEVDTKMYSSAWVDNVNAAVVYGDGLYSSNAVTQLVDGNYSNELYINAGWSSQSTYGNWWFNRDKTNLFVTFEFKNPLWRIRSGNGISWYEKNMNLSNQSIGVVADTDSSSRFGYFDWIKVKKALLNDLKVFVRESNESVDWSLIYPMYVDFTTPSDKYSKIVEPYNWTYRALGYYSITGGVINVRSNNTRRYFNSLFRFVGEDNIVTQFRLKSSAADNRFMSLIGDRRRWTYWRAWIHDYYYWWNDVGAVYRCGSTSEYRPRNLGTMNNDTWYQTVLKLVNWYFEEELKTDSGEVLGRRRDVTCNWANNPMWLVWWAKYYSYVDSIDWVKAVRYIPIAPKVYAY